MINTNTLKQYSDKKVLITGGLGFIGSNLAHKLTKLGAGVSIIDNLNPLYGGNLFNVENIKDKVEVVIGDIRDKNLVTKMVTGKDMIFDLAAQVSHSDSGNMPFEDLDINCKGHLTIFEASKQQRVKPKIVFTSSRLVLGKIMENPVIENHPTNPLSLYGVHKLTAEKYCQVYYKNHGVPTTILRLTNPYGERQQIKHSKYSLPGWFIRLAIENKVIKIFGDGKQLRDYIHIKDVVEALLLVGINSKTDGQIYNCGLGKSLEFKRMVELIIKIVGSGSIEHVPWPENYEKEETGNFETDISKLQNATGWQPKIELEEGLRRTFEFYKRYGDKYIPK